MSLRVCVTASLVLAVQADFGLGLGGCELLAAAVDYSYGPESLKLREVQLAWDDELDSDTDGILDHKECQLYTGKNAWYTVVGRSGNCGESDAYWELQLQGEDDEGLVRMAMGEPGHGNRCIYNKINHRNDMRWDSLVSYSKSTTGAAGGTADGAPASPKVRTSQCGFYKEAAGLHLRNKITDETGSLHGDFITAYLKFPTETSSHHHDESTKFTNCAGRVVVSFKVNSCSPRMQTWIPSRPETEDSCSQGFSAQAMHSTGFLHIASLPAASRPPTPEFGAPLKWSDNKVCGAVAAPWEPTANASDTSCCPPEYCRAPELSSALSQWGQCEFAEVVSPEIVVPMHSGKFFTVDVTSLLHQAHTDGKGEQMEPTLKLFVTTTHNTNGLAIAVDIEDIQMQCVPLEAADVVV